MISARPPENWSSVANCSHTRTGSSEPSTVTELVRRIFSVASAAPANHRRGGPDEVGAMVLTDGEEVEADLVRDPGLLDRVAGPLLARRRETHQWRGRR